MNIAATLTASELRRDRTLDQDQLNRGWRPIGDDMLDHAQVRLLLPQYCVVRGWANRLQPGMPITCWTWDRRFSQALPMGKRPGLVTPIGWCVDEDDDNPDIPPVDAYAPEGPDAA